MSEIPGTMRRTAAFIFFLLLANLCFGTQLDSIQAALKGCKDPLLKAKILNELSWLYVNIDPSKTKMYASESLELSRKFADKKSEANALFNLAIAADFSGDFDKALAIHEQAVQIRKRIKDAEGLAFSFHNIAIVHQLKGNFKNAIEYYKKAIIEARRANRDDRVAASLSNLGAALQRQGAFEESMNHYLQAFTIAEKTDNKPLQGTCFFNFGYIFYSQKQYNRAIENYTKALNIFKEIGNKKGEGEIYTNLASVYSQTNQDIKAEKSLKLAIEINKSMGDLQGMVVPLMNLGSLKHYAGDYKSSVQFLTEALDLSKKLNLQREVAFCQKNLALSYMKTGKGEKALALLKEAEVYVTDAAVLPLMRDLQHVYFQTYESLGDYKKAFFHATQYAALSDSLTNDDINKRIAEMEAQFEVEKQKSEVKALTNEKKLQATVIENQNLQRNALFAGLALVLGLAGVSFKAYRVKKRANADLQERNNEILRKNQEIIHQKGIIEEKNKDITDSINYARQIQEAILPYSSRISSAFPQHFILYRPKDIVSGDFYWFVERDGKVFFAVVDCTGHGVPGAFMSMVASAALNHIVLEKNIVHSNFILNELHRDIRQALKQHEGKNRDGMDICLCVVDKESRTLEFSGANNPLMFIRNGELQVIKGDKKSIGGLQTEESRTFTRHELVLDCTTLLYLTTDGYADQFGGIKGKKFKDRNLRQLLIDIHEWPMELQQKALLESFDQWRGGFEQIDDVCIMGVKLDSTIG